MMPTNVCLVTMTAVRMHNALMLKEHIAANVSLVILVTVPSVPMSTSARQACHHVTTGRSVITHLDHFIVPVNLVSRWMRIEIVLTSTNACTPVKTTVMMLQPVQTLLAATLALVTVDTLVTVSFAKKIEKQHL